MYGDLVHKTVLLEKYLVATDSWECIGTGFIVNKDGWLITAKHNIDLDFIDTYTATYKQVRYRIKEIESINYSYTGIDIILLSLVIRDKSVISYFKISKVNDQRALCRDVFICGYLSEDKLFRVTKTFVTSYTNGVFILQGGNSGKGISGSPVVLAHTGEIVGVVSQRRDLTISHTGTINSEGFGSCYATSINFTPAWDRLIATYEQTEGLITSTGALSIADGDIEGQLHKQINQYKLVVSHFEIDG